MRRFNGVIWLLVVGVLLSVSPAWAAPATVGKFGDIIVKGPWMDSRAFSNLAAADAAATSAGRELLIAKEYSISTATTLSSHVRVVPGGRFTKSGSGTLAFSGGFECPVNYQAFNQFSAGDVTGLDYSRPEWWGAKGDGITDDADPLYSAAVAATGKILKLAAKTYVTSSAVQLFSYTTLEGAGSAATTIKLKDNSTAGIGARGAGCVQAANYPAGGYGGGLNPTVPASFDALTTFYHITMRGLTLDGNKANQSNSVLMAASFVLVDTLTVEDCIIKNSKNSGLGIAASRNIRVRGNSFIDNALNSLFIADSEKFWITDNYSTGASDYAFEIGAGESTGTQNATSALPPKFSGNPYCFGGVIKGNHITDSNNSGLVIKSYNSGLTERIIASGNTVINSTVDATSDAASGSGIVVLSSLTTDVRNTVISDNICNDNAYDGLHVYANTAGHSGLTITNNQCRGNGKRGMNLNGLQRSIVANNIVRDNGETGVIVNACYLTDYHHNRHVGNGNVTSKNSLQSSNNEAVIFADNSFIDKLSDYGGYGFGLNDTGSFSCSFERNRFNATNAVQVYAFSDGNNKHIDNSYQAVASTNTASAMLYYSAGSTWQYSDPSTAYRGVISVAGAYSGAARAATTSYTISPASMRKGDSGSGVNYVYIPTVGGTTGSGAVTWPTTVGQTVVDGTVVWKCVAPLATVRKIVPAP